MEVLNIISLYLVLSGEEELLKMLTEAPTQAESRCSLPSSSC